MSHAEQPRRVTGCTSDTLMRLLETHPDALLVLDDADTIVYANASAHAMTGATPEEVCGTSLWCYAPHLVSTSLYQAVQQTKESRAPTAVAYVSPLTHRWLHVSLWPTETGLALFFQEQLYRDLLESFSEGVTILTPDGLVLDMNQHPLAETPLRREVVGKAFIDLPVWSHDLAVQQHVRAAMARASRGETVRFEVHIHPRSGLSLDLLLTMSPHCDASQRVEYLICASQVITERKQAEDDLRTLVDAIPHMVWTMLPDGAADYVNQRWCDYTGKTSEQAQGDGWLQAIHPEDRLHTQQARQTAVETGTSYEVEHRIQQGSTGTYRWFLARAMPHKDAQGRIVRWFGTCTDIHDKKQTEQQLKESEEHWRVLAETVPQLVWAVRPDGQHEYANQRWCDYTGFTLEHMQNDKWAHLQFIHPADREGNRARLRHALDTGATYEHEERLYNGQTGTYRWFLTRAMPVRDETGHITKWFGTSTDIEEQKRAEQRLKENEENWRVLAETLPHLVWVMLPDGHFEYTNQRVGDYLGALPQSILGEEWRPFVHPEDYERIQAARRYTLATGELYEMEYRLKESHTGAYRWMLGRAMPVRDEAGQIVTWFATSTDIDEQKRTEQALRESQQRIHALINSNIIGILCVEGEEEVIAEANGVSLLVSGYTQEDVHSRTLTRARMTPPEDAPLFQRAHQELAERGQHTPFETELVRKDGSRLPIIVGGVFFQDRPRQIICFVLDNSARKELEQRKDAFISMASHELKTPLTALKLQTTLLHRQLTRQSIQACTPALSRMEAQINTLTRLVEELLDVSKIQAGRLEHRQERVELDALLHEIADTMQQSSPSHTILMHGATQSSLIGDHDRLGQVFINLLSNAIKYSPDAQTVEMELSASEEAVMIRVRDHGLGIPREQCEKIFERFYRVAGPRQQAIAGLGMGLYIVAEIVKHHGGTISVDSEVERGSTFTVTLPLKNERGEQRFYRGTHHSSQTD